MVRRNPEGALSEEEKRVVKGLLERGWRNQDIQALVNIGRSATINSARITEVKFDEDQKPADADKVEFFEIKKRSYDPVTGLNLFDDERLIRAREAMILAVQIFNSPSLRFKTEVFVVLANIAWTYLLHEFYTRKHKKFPQSNGRSLALSKMLKMNDCPLTEGMKNNLQSIKIIRDSVEHELLGNSDGKWNGIFQACCLNFDKIMCELFGDKLSLSSDLSFALQFTRMNIEQLSTLNKYEIPKHIESVDARLGEGLSDEQLSDLEYQFRVIFTMDSASKSRSHFEFVRPDSAEGKEIQNVLVQYRAGDHLYPYKPGQVAKLVSAGAGRAFSTNLHARAWKKYKARPRAGSAQPENTNNEYCIFHPAHRDYTYSEKWIEFLIQELSDDQTYDAIKSFKP